MSSSSIDWPSRGKTINELIAELQTFEDLDCLVEISVDGGFTSRPISVVVGDGIKCLLVNMEEG
jgi:hypothetical protein